MPSGYGGRFPGRLFPRKPSTFRTGLVLETVISEDPSTPAVVTGSGTGPITTASFSPPAGALLLALVAGGKSSATLTAAITDSIVLTWITKFSFSGATGDSGGLTAAYCTYLNTAPGSMTVTATYTGFGTGGGRTLAVFVLNGANPSQAWSGQGNWFYGGTPTTSAYTSFPTTVSNPWVYGLNVQTDGTDALTSPMYEVVSDFASSESTRMVVGRVSSIVDVPGTNVFSGGTWSNTALSIASALEILPLQSVLLNTNQGSFLPFFG